MPTKNVKVSPKCNRTYEIYYQGNYHVMLIVDIPTYGKERKVCPQCKGEDMIAKTMY